MRNDKANDRRARLPLAEHPCPRVQLCMECPECGYPYSEALYELDPAVPHLPEESGRMTPRKAP
jgi:hypothetical protein